MKIEFFRLFLFTILWFNESLNYFFVSSQKVLFKWKGSVYKLIFKEMIVYLLLYFILNGFYRAVLTQDGWEVYRYAFESLKGILEISIILRQIS